LNSRNRQATVNDGVNSVDSRDFEHNATPKDYTTDAKRQDSHSGLRVKDGKSTKHTSDPCRHIG